MYKRQALTSRTAQLPGISLDSPGRVIGGNTADCMRSGVVYGAASMIDGMCARIEQELGTACLLYTSRVPFHYLWNTDHYTDFLGMGMFLSREICYNKFVNLGKKVLGMSFGSNIL